MGLVSLCTSAALIVADLKQPASFPPLQLLIGIIFWNRKVPLQDIGQRMGGEAPVAHTFAGAENLSDHAIALQLPKIRSIPGKARIFFPLNVYELTAFRELLLYLYDARYRYTIYLSKLLLRSHIYEAERLKSKQNHQL